MAKQGGDQKPGKKRPTLKTLADATGLSLSTVSLSLRGGSNLKQDTIDKVVAEARKQGYVPDRAGVRLRTGKTNVLTLVLDGDANSFEYTRFIIEGIGRTLAGSRYHLNVTPSFADENKLDAVKYLLDNHLADGLILTHTRPQDERVKALLENGLPFVTHGRTELFSPHAYHDFDSEAFVEMSVDRLVERGAERIMIVVSSANTVNDRRVLNVFRDVAENRNIKSALHHEVPPDATNKEIHALGLKIARDGKCPDGILMNNEFMAFPFLSGLRDGGIMPGVDTFLVVKQISNILQTVFPHVEAVKEDVVAAGAELARQLLQQIEGAPIADCQSLRQPIPDWK